MPPRALYHISKIEVASPNVLRRDVLADSDCYCNLKQTNDMRTVFSRSPKFRKSALLSTSIPQ